MNEGGLGLEGDRSVLFFDIVKMKGYIELVFTDCLRLWFVENVSSMDLRWVKVFNTCLEVTPLLLCPRFMSRVRRGRYFWSNLALASDLDCCSWITFNDHGLFLEVVYEAVSLDFEWHSVEQKFLGQLETILPTFTGAIERGRPPTDPAGIKKLGAWIFTICGGLSSVFSVHIP